MKKAKSTRWFSLHVSADNAYSEYEGLLKTLTVLVEESGRLDSMEKNFIKNMSISNFFEMFYTLKMVHPPLFANQCHKLFEDYSECPQNKN